MNLTLFRSWHLVFALVIVLLFPVWAHLAEPAIGVNWREEYRFTFLLVTGWVALVLMLVVVLYSLRKHVHWLGLSPETRNRPSTRQLEAAGRRFNALRREIRRGLVQEKAEVLEKAQRILKEEGIHRVVRVIVVEGTGDGLRYDVEVKNREPLGRVATWLHAHLYYGLASGMLVFLHGGGSMVSPMGWTLNVLSLLVIVTGVVGVFLYAAGPRWLTRLERDLTFEEAYVLDVSFRRKLDGVVKDLVEGSELRKPIRAVVQEARRGGEGYADRAGALLAAAKGREDESTIRDLVVLAGQLRLVRRDLQGLRYVKFWMNLWRAIHIPLSVLLLGLIFIHVVSVLWY